MSENKQQHPSFGLIAVYRTSCGPSGMPLFGSDALHHHLVHVEINTAEVVHDLSRDWYHSKDRLIEFYMSEAQWARFVSSFGDGGGTPVTLRHTETRRNIPNPPPPKPLVEPFHKDVDERISIINDEANALKRKLLELREGLKAVSKKDLDELISRIDSVQRQLNANLEFVEKSFKEKMEKHVNDAMIDFEAQVSHSLRAKGLEALKREIAELPEQKPGESLPAETL